MSVRRTVVAVLLLVAAVLGGGRPATASTSAAAAVLQGEVVHWYRTILGRGPDSAGLAYWSAYVRSDCVNNLPRAATFFHDTDEAWRRGVSNRDRVLYLYRSILHREPDRGGLAYWSGRIDAVGRPAWRSVVRGISYSGEARGRVWGVMCRNYQLELVERINLDHSYGGWLHLAPNSSTGTGNGLLAFPGLVWTNDGCSGVPDAGFTDACLRHDFGYRNLKQTDADFSWLAGQAAALSDTVWDGYNKSDVDYQFREDMYVVCAGRRGISGSLCRRHADLYFHGVRTAAETRWRNLVSSDLNNFWWRGRG